MENDLLSIYEQHYLRPQPITESVNTTVSDNSETEVEVLEEAKSKKKKKFVPFKKKEKGKSSTAATDYGCESVSFDNIFDKIIREEFGEEDIDDAGADSDTTYDFDGEGDDLDNTGGDDQSFTLSELKNMTLGELASLVGGGEEEQDDGVENFDMDAEDEIPQESYAFDGGGKNIGMQNNYDGKARKLAPTNHVKANGDIDKSKQDTGYDPEDTEGSEGAEHGMQDEYDGKAKTQAKTTHVKANGDADFGKVKTGHKTSSGKKDKNYF